MLQEVLEAELDRERNRLEEASSRYTLQEKSKEQLFEQEKVRVSE